MSNNEFTPPPVKRNMAEMLAEFMESTLTILQKHQDQIDNLTTMISTVRDVLNTYEKRIAVLEKKLKE